MTFQEILKKYGMTCGTIRADLACGDAKQKPDFIGVDIADQCSTADIKHDLVKGIPFCNDSCQYLICYNFMEHMTNDQWLEFMWECWRVLIPNGTLDILVPHGLSETHIKDPTHKHNGFCEKIFTYFEAGNKRQKQYHLPPFHVEKSIRQGNLIVAILKAVKN